ncbi:MAG: major facilitator superfamily 1 [Devosia sp.]|uniref:MFS transporter n=1 Tax=Devosia sp. TaxID=1871048 RepID=UPI00260E8D9E|nr:MFS transporter [Devosia sp.]MDB5540459.1 major facilitator superfamily 1 [Devosia sp.]
MRIIPLVLAVALFMENMDSTVIATSLPAIAADIGAEPISLKLALTAYFVALAIFIPLSGWMADRFGSKNIFRIAIVVFMAGSICCAFSDSLLTFVLSRFLQGIGGSMMTPVARLVLVRSTPRNELVSAMAWLTIPALIGPIAGPPLGGFLTTYLSWHWIFWINVPIGLIGLVLVTRLLHTAEGRNERPIDVPGLILSGLTFAGVLFGISVISLPAIPAVAGYGSIVFGTVAGVLYLRHARRTAMPILDPKLFRLPLFRSAIIGGSLFRIGIGAFPFLMPLMLQLAFGLTPFESGLTTFVAAIGALLSKFGVERVFATFGFPRTLMLTAAIGCIFLGINGLFTPAVPHWLLMGSLLVGGLTRSFFFTGVNALAFADVDEAHASQATAINAVSQQLSVAAGVAVAGGALEFAANLHGGNLTLGDFHIAWFVVAAVAIFSVIPFMRLPPDAGSDVSGHQVKPMPKPVSATL